MQKERDLIIRIKQFSKFAYSKHRFVGHIVPVVNAAIELSDRLKADRTIVEAGAYLHEIGNTVVGAYMRQYSGPSVANWFLYLIGMEKAKRDEVVKCVGHDTLPAANNSLEVQIVANAHVVGQIFTSFYMFGNCYRENRNLDSTSNWLKEEYLRAVQQHLNLPAAVEMVNKKYTLLVSLICLQQKYCTER
jgi:HD superfamily phosphodiesterase